MPFKIRQNLASSGSKTRKLVIHNRERQQLGRVDAPGATNSSARAGCACSRCGMGLVWIFFSHLPVFFFFLTLSVWETARYRLKQPLDPYQLTDIFMAKFFFPLIIDLKAICPMLVSLWSYYRAIVDWLITVTVLHPDANFSFYGFSTISYSQPEFLISLCATYFNTLR